MVCALHVQLGDQGPRRAGESVISWISALGGLGFPGSMKCEASKPKRIPGKASKTARWRLSGVSQKSSGSGGLGS